MLQLQRCLHGPLMLRPAQTRHPDERHTDATSVRECVQEEPRLTIAPQSLRCPQACSSHWAATPGFQIPAGNVWSALRLYTGHNANTKTLYAASASSIPGLELAVLLILQDEQTRCAFLRALPCMKIHLTCRGLLGSSPCCRRCSAMVLSINVPAFAQERLNAISFIWLSRASGTPSELAL